MFRVTKSEFSKAVALVVLSTVAGCEFGAKGDLPLARVNGTVVLDGSPLAKAKVEFNPVAVPEKTKKGRPVIGGSVAITDANGNYELKFDSRRRGAVPGEHTVKITTSDIDPGSSKPQFEKVPRQYNVATKLKQTVEEGANEIDFELTTSATVRR